MIIANAVISSTDLSEQVVSVNVTLTQQAREIPCLPLNYVPGRLLGIDADHHSGVLAINEAPVQFHPTLAAVTRGSLGSKALGAALGAGIDTS